MKNENLLNTSEHGHYSLVITFAWVFDSIGNARDTNAPSLFSHRSLELFAGCNGNAENWYELRSYYNSVHSSVLDVRATIISTDRVACTKNLLFVIIVFVYYSINA